MGVFGHLLTVHGLHSAAACRDPGGDLVKLVICVARGHLILIFLKCFPIMFFMIDCGYINPTYDI